MELKKHWFYMVMPTFSMVTGIGILWFIYALLRYNLDKITIENGHFNTRTGVLFIQQDSIKIDRIHQITINKGIFGRIFGYGTIMIQSGATYGAIGYSFIVNPDQAKNLLESSEK